MSADIRKSVCKKIYATVKSSPLANEFDLINLNELSNAESASYAEKQLISKEFLRLKDKASFMLSKEGDVSIMLCEEDHIKINAFSAGQDLFTAYNKANALDDIFISAFKLAYSDRLGFLTASPMNLGTGLKVSFALHLPALARQKAIYRLSAMVSKLGLTLRELYRNGAGDIYILSNGVTLGITEKNAMDNLTAICDQLVKQERAAREELKKDVEFEDRIYRTLGIMKTARKLERGEFLEYVSLLRLGSALGYLDVDYKTIGEMMHTLQDASIISGSNAEIDGLECAKIRAQKVREILK